MGKSNKYKLHIKIQIETASLAQTGKGLGVLFRKHLIPRQIMCTTERTNDTEVSLKAETVIQKLLGRPSAWDQVGGETLPTTRTITLDDAKIYQLAKRWDSSEITESMVVVPHISYLPLLQCFMRNLELQASEVLKQVCIFLDYAVLERVPDIVKQCFFGERTEVLKYVRRMGLSCIDPGRQLFMENLISLACYMIPAKYLVFIDDDFLIKDAAWIDRVLDPLRRGYLLSGRYTSSQDRIHTSFFGLRPECLRDELSLFDYGENRYADKLTSTGTITYRTLSKRGKGVFILRDYQDGDGPMGRHLGHVATELWVDLPKILGSHFRLEMFPQEVGRMKMDASILLEALALLLKIKRDGSDYYNVVNELRHKAAEGRDFVTYLSRVYNNHHWLVGQADSR